MSPALEQQYQAISQDHASAETYFQEMHKAATRMMAAATAQIDASTRAADLAHAAALAHARAANMSAESGAEYSTTADAAEILKVHAEQAYQQLHLALKGNVDLHRGSALAEIEQQQVDHDQIEPHKPSLSGLELPPQWRGRPSS